MIKFEQYEKMIMDKAHKVSRKYHIDFDECVSIGYEIYVNAITKFDETKGAKFSTYLYIELNRMVDEAKRQSKLSCDSLDDTFVVSGEDELHFEDLFGDKETPDNSKLFELAKQELSYEAYRLFNWAISFNWQDFSKQRVPSFPTKKMAIKGCGFARDVIESAWCECESFWNTIGWKVA